jgi:hypothetical protein
MEDRQYIAMDYKEHIVPFKKKTKSILYQGLIFWKRSKLYKHAYIKWYKFIPAGNERCYNEDVGKYLYENCKIGTYKTK